MRNFKSYIRTLAVVALAAVGFTACQDDVDAPAAVAPVSELQPNTTLLELKTMFWDEATNYAEVIKDESDPERRFIIHGTVVSSDEEGNIFKSIVIQDETAALAFSVDSYNLYLKYRPGQEIILDVTGMEIGKYAGLQQVGRKSWYENGNSWQVSFLAAETFHQKAEPNGYPTPAAIDTLNINSFSELSQTPEGLRKYQSRLVRLKNVYFEEGGKRKLSVWHTSENDEQNTNIVDGNGNTLIVRTSGYCSFFNTTLPVGNIDIVGILSYYNTAWQLLLIDGDGIINVGERPGNKENPYTVEEAIADEAAGITADGWVKGHIVGTLAPEVEDNVSANEHLQFEGDFVVATSLVIADSPDCRDYTKCMVIPVPMGSKLQEYGNLRNNPANLGKGILIKGKLEKYMGTWGLTGNSGAADEFEIDGIVIEPETGAKGDGTLQNPYNATAANEVAATLDSSSSIEGIYVKGTISSIKEIDTGSYGNASYYISDESGATFYIFRGYYLNGEKFTSEAQLKVGTEVVVRGDLINYMGNTPELAQGNSIVSIGSGGGGDTPVTPPSGSEGDGSFESPYNATAANIAAGTLADGEKIEEVYVKGTISSIKDVDTGSYGNASYYISDASGEKFYIFRGYYLNGEKFTSEDQLAVGAEVLVCGDLINYMGNTPELAQGNYIVSYTPGTGGGDTPGGGDEPVNPGDAITILPSALTIPGSSTVDGYTLVSDQHGGSTAPMFHEKSGAMRLYADNELTISGGNISKIVFEIASTNSYRYTTFTPDTGALNPAQAVGDTSVTWEGNASSITFTVGHDADLGSDGSSKRGQIHISKIYIYPAK